MSLIKCPSCRKPISDKVKICPHCDYDFDQSQQELEKLKVKNFRKYRDKMYYYKMLTFASIAIAVIGIVPMLWTYAKAIDYGFNASLTKHWGIFLVIAGFIIYLGIRASMFITKKNYYAGKK